VNPAALKLRRDVVKPLVDALAAAAAAASTQAAA
jgi:hypothetical protein